MPWIILLPFIVYSLVIGGIFAYREDIKTSAMVKPWLTGLVLIAALECAALLFYTRVYIPRQDYVDVLSYQEARNAFPDFLYPSLREEEEKSAQVYVTKNKLSKHPCEAISLVFTDSEGSCFTINGGYREKALSAWKEASTVLVNGENIPFRWEEKGTSWNPEGLYYHCTIQLLFAGNRYNLTKITYAQNDPAPQKEAYVTSLLGLLPSNDRTASP